MNEFLFTYDKKNSKSGNSLNDLDIMKTKPKTNHIFIYDTIQENPRNIPSGMVAIIDSNGNNVINEPIQYNFIYKTDSKTSHGILEDKDILEETFPEIRKPIKYGFKMVDIWTGGHFLIFDDEMAMFIQNGSGFNYVGCNIGKIIKT